MLWDVESAEPRVSLITCEVRQLARQAKQRLFPYLIGPFPIFIGSVSPSIGPVP